MRRRFGAAAILLGSMGLSVAAWGQSAKDESVGDRAHSDFEPIGLQLGNFLLHATLANDGEYNDNIFRDQTKTSDMIARLKPALTLTGELYDTSLALSAKAEIGRYAEFHTENYEDFDFAASAQRDIAEESSVAITLRRALLHEPRGSLSDPGRAFGPTQYYLTTVTLVPTYSASPLVGRAKIEGRYLDYQPNGPLSNHDRTEYQLYASNRLGYQFDPGWTVFVEPSGELHEFPYGATSGTQGNFQPNNNQASGDHVVYQVLGGFTYDATADLYIELGGGYFINTYFQSGQQNLTGAAFTGSTIWNIDPTLTLTSTLGRQVQDVTPFDTTLNTHSVVTTTSKTRLDYEADDNIVTYVAGGLSNDDYQGAHLIENTFSFELGGTYYFNEYLRLGFQYIFELRDSTLATRRLDNNRLIFSLIAQL
jgi:hypothetical protein